MTELSIQIIASPGMEHVGTETGGSVLTPRNIVLVLKFAHIAPGQAFTIKNALFECLRFDCFANGLFYYLVNGSCSGINGTVQIGLRF